MPYCKVGRCKADEIVDSETDGLNGSSEDEESINIFYQRYGRGPTKVLFIIGLAGDHQSWDAQLLGLCGTNIPNEEDDVESGNRGGDDDCLESQDSKDGSKSYSVRDSRSKEYENTRESTANGIEACTFDNRGVGLSSIPKSKSAYRTDTMARDALALLDHLGWEKVHVSGHSMGGMIACKLAAMAPHRLSSLTLIGVTGGGYQCLPKFNRKSFSMAYRIYRAKTPEERAAVDLETHYTHEYLDSAEGDTTRRALLFKEYVKNLLSGGMQPRYGLEGQASACWHHSLSAEEVDTIRSTGIIVAVIHGRGDVIAQVEHARTLAKKLHPVARMIELPGGHLVTHQNADEVNGILKGVMRAVRMNVQCTEFKASDAGLSEGGGYWQKTEDTSSVGVVQDQGAVELQLQISSTDFAVSALCRIMLYKLAIEFLLTYILFTIFYLYFLPDVKELLDIIPLLGRISELFRIGKLRQNILEYRGQLSDTVYDWVRRI